MSALDLLLLLMILIWGANFSVIKYALLDFPEISFNAMRLLIASTVFLIVIAVQRRGGRPRLTAVEWKRIVLLGLVGHFFYQLAFMGGVARTSVANSALIFGCTPVMVAILASVAGHERLTPGRLAGGALSLAGIYALVGRRASLSSATLLGDALVFIGMTCWSIYSVAAQPMLRRHSPLVITGLSMACGAAFYMLLGVPAFLSTNWAAISTISWLLMAASSLLALAFAYIVWYTAVQRMGSSRTATYSNLTPLVAMIIGAIWLREPIEAAQLVGAALILAGVFVTRMTFAPPSIPPE